MSTPEARRRAESAYRDRMTAAGYRIRQVWVHDGDWAFVRQMLESLRGQREGPPERGKGDD